MGRIEFFFAECGATYTVEQISKLSAINERYHTLMYWKSHKIKYINNMKKELKALFAKAVEHNQMADNAYLRRLHPSALNERNIISIFESSLTRILGMETDTLSTDIMVVKTFYFDVIQDLILNGFEYNGEKYIFLTASAGQIRTKKTVFIKEALWKQHERTLMCGLTIDDINARGGVNVNKFLAYLALSNSATDEWTDFDIDRCIVVPDFETEVYGTVDFIDDTTYKVERQEMGIGIEHTDGCGLMLPSVSKKNFMVRAPWLKGLLGVFDFRKFIEEHNASPIIKDVYGDEHDVIAEDIHIIFTKSQFKLWKYYTDWNAYKEAFKKYNCQVGKCKIEEDRIKSSRLSYQMLQTLTDITPDEIRRITTPAVEKLDRLTSDVGTMLDAFGAVKGRNLSPFQEALMIYPEMLGDKYCKRQLNEIKNSLIKEYHAGRIPVKGKYTFVLPDLYAVCQNWFLHMESPPGLLENGQVSCRLYKRAKKLDCLRSPHLYREHAVRENVVDETTGEWFQTDAVYTSCFDMCSKILQFDCDGDTLLVVADKTIIEVAERNMEGVVPLFYNMRKAEPTILTSEQFYKGMTDAWTGGNIGEISNDITKIWNRDGGVGENEDLAVKLLCCDNNFVIDYAKTLYKPTRPPEIDEFIRQYTRAKLPRFFADAKNYNTAQLMPLNNSLVNQLRHYIKKKRLKFKQVENFNYRNLMSDAECSYVSPTLTATYDELSKAYRHRINFDSDDESENNVPWIILESKRKLLECEYTDVEIADMLVKYLYSEDSEAKMLLWACFGDILLNNLKQHINPDERYCVHCGKRFVPRANAHRYCDTCFAEKRCKPDERIVICKDCGKVFIVPKSTRNKTRCDECQLEEYRRRDREKKRRKRERLKASPTLN